MFEAHFQTFEEPEGGVALTARLARFREELARRKLTGFVIPRADQQQNEYVPASEERLAWLTGFTGSAGMAIVLSREAAIFVDGRYTLQAAKQVDRKAWHIEPLADPPPEHWLAKQLAAGDRLGFDPWLHTSAAAERLAAACTKAGAELVAVDSNPLDQVWTERPAPPLGPYLVQRVAVDGDQLRAGLGAGGGQALGCRGSVQPRVKTEAVAGRKLLGQPVFRRRIGQRLDMPGLAVDLLGGLQRIAAVDENGGLAAQDD